MNIKRALNMYHYLRQQNTNEREIDMFVNAMCNVYNISLYNYNREWLRANRNPNKNDINNYNRGGSRTLNTTRQLGGC